MASLEVLMIYQCLQIPIQSLTAWSNLLGICSSREVDI